MSGSMLRATQTRKHAWNQEKVERHGRVGETLGCALYEQGGLRSRAGVRMSGSMLRATQTRKHAWNQEKVERHGRVGETLGCALYEQGGLRSRAGEPCFMEKRQRRRGKDAI